MSLTYSPVRPRRNQSLGSNTRVVRAKSAGSCSRSQSSLGAVNPGIAALPAMARSAGTAASSALHCALLRPSFHRMAGRRTTSSRSRRTAPCICPDGPIARTAAIAAGCAARSRSIAASSAAHQSAGSCSAQRGCGRTVTSASPTLATSRCASSRSTSFSSDVPRSMPRYMSRAQASKGATEAVAGLQAKLRRRHALDLAEAPVEVGDVVKPHLVADQRHLPIGFHQQLAGAVDANQVDEVGEGVARRAAKEAREAALAHAELGRHLAGDERTSQVAGDAVDDGVDLRHPGIVVLALHLHVREQPVVGAAGEVGEEVAEGGEALHAATLLDVVPMLSAALGDAEELDAVARALEQRQRLGELG